MKPALSQVCSLHWPLEQDVADYAAGACTAIELWTGKLDAYLEGHSEDDFKALLSQHGMNAPVASFQGGLLDSQADFRRQHWDAFAARLAQLRRLGTGTLVVAADIRHPLDQETLDRVAVSLAEAAELAARHEMRLALEFQAGAAFANNLQTAAALVADANHPSLGLCLDAFHFFTGSSKEIDLELLTNANLFHVQLCDIAGIPRELAGDADRVLPGDGDFPLERLVARLRVIDYQGHVAVELMNPAIWRVPPRQFGEIAMTALRLALGQASMGSAEE
jgi:2-keto-myo-inositol isomerase